MRWPWRGRDAGGDVRADEALRRTEGRLEEGRRKEAAGRELAARIRRMREANHLAESVARALEEGRRR